MIRAALRSVLACTLLLPCTGSEAQSDLLYANGFENDASTQIAAVRALPDGSATAAIDAALVTYVKPPLGADVAGFFVQGGPFGPALFVAIDPASLAPPAQPGDVVSFVVTQLATSQGLRVVASLSSYVRLATGQALPPQTQNLSSAADLVTALESYESELVAISANVAANFAPAGAGFVSAQLDTAGVIGNSDLRLRVPATLADALDLVLGCTFTAQSVPMWRFNTQAQPSPFNASEFTLLDCPAPRVLSALALSPTSVRVAFDRNLLASSVAANGTQFGFDMGLAASAAMVSGRTATVTTSTQVAGLGYTVTVAPTVTDLTGKGVGAGANSAAFSGFLVAAPLVINEVHPNLTSSRDLVELRALGPGTTNGVQLVQDPGAAGAGTVLATLPAITVAAGDLIVVHLAPVGQSDETLSKSQCADAACYPNAWDVRGGVTGITYSNRVLALRSPVDGSLLDAVPFAITASTSPAAFPGNVQFVQAAGLWMPTDCGGAPCTYVSTPTVVQISTNWTGLSASTSVQRMGADTNSAADWQIAPSTFGLANP